jgi:hypothetical protein
MHVHVRQPFGNCQLSEFLLGFLLVIAGLFFAIVLSVFLRFTASGYLFDIFKLFLVDLYGEAM